MESVRGAISAAPTPWSPRQTISVTSRLASPQAAEKIVKATRPIK
jgi:hypothetical protein